MMPIFILLAWPFRGSVSVRSLVTPSLPSTNPRLEELPSGTTHALLLRDGRWSVRIRHRT
jgi:hypothetical protein